MFIQRTGVGRLALCVSLIASLAACSHSPSEGDANAAIKTRLGDCKYFSIGSFDKVNGIPVDDNDYRMEVRYSITMDLDSRYHDRLKQHMKNVEGFTAMNADFDARLEKFNTEMLAYNEAHADDGSPRYETTHPSPMNDLTTPEQRAMQADAQSDIKSVLVQSISQECPALDRRLLTNFFDAQTPMKNYADDVTYNFTETLAMMKTDNGWQEAR
ncbi:hypothetical protein AWB81_08576 [Caballeronia arationis]|uniref:hypothetical protein n=1 Tax=Caballeronia arationis TaxID=1777142 RepID=UPI00074CD892|nr:hypothetical protein [Caballeronia arationis]SAL08082.1 hypothetical protein AWB81_08576 [Caballeronia arationis]